MLHLRLIKRFDRLIRASMIVLLAVPALVHAQAVEGVAPAAAATVGPAHGTVMVVGGGGLRPAIYKEFIALAGGPDALIVLMPTAGPDSVYSQNFPGKFGWINAGATNLYVLHTTDRRLADSDSFVAVLHKASGVWFDGGRQYRLVDAYAGTRTETALREVLARGGIIGGTSAGASILGSFLVRGAPSNDVAVMDYKTYEKGFGYLRGVAIDQHAVARQRLADLADSIIPRHPDLLGMSADEGTAWVVRGDTGTIVGDSKAFVYNARGESDPGRPFITLLPGDRFDLSARRITHRAAGDAPFDAAFIDSLFTGYDDASHGGATVLVARDGEVYVDRSYGVPRQPKYMPTTTLPQFRLGGVQEPIADLCMAIPEPPVRGGEPASAGSQSVMGRCVARLGPLVGWEMTSAVDAGEGEITSSVDELYRFALRLEDFRAAARDSTARSGFSRGWTTGRYDGASRLVAYGTREGRRNAFVRIPDHGVTIIILSNDEKLEARTIADRITDRLLVRGLRPNQRPRSDVGARIDSLIADFMSANHIPGASLAVIRGPDTIRLRGYGFADLRLRRRAGPTTVYSIASTTKQITAAAILRLSEQHKLRLDDDVKAYLPTLSTHGHRVTIRELLTHTSGVANALNTEWAPGFDHDVAPDSVLGFLEHKPFLFTPGTRFEYSNTGYQLLGLIIEHVSGRSYGDYIADEFFKPLGMTQTRYCPPFAQRDTSFARGYDWSPGDPNTAEAPLYNVRLGFAAGAVCSTVRDLARWQHALHTGQVLSAPAYHDMTTAGRLNDGRRLSYGFGLMIDDVGTHRMLEHGGAWMGSIGFDAWIADDSLNIAFEGNNAIPDDVLMFNLARAVYGLPLLDRVHLPPSVPLDPRLRDRVLGTYAFLDRDEVPMAIRIYLSGDTLRFSFDGRPRPLLYFGNGSFGARFLPSMRLKFDGGDAPPKGATLEWVGRTMRGNRVSNPPD